MAEPTLGELLADLTHEIGQLFRQEISLATREIGNKAVAASRDAGAVGAGAALGFAGLLTLLAALVSWLGGGSRRMTRSAAAVGLLTTAAGGGLAVRGLADLRRRDWVPHQTLESLHDKP